MQKHNELNILCFAGQSRTFSTGRKERINESPMGSCIRIARRYGGRFRGRSCARRKDRAKGGREGPRVQAQGSIRGRAVTGRTPQGRERRARVLPLGKLVTLLPKATGSVATRPEANRRSRREGGGH